MNVSFHIHLNDPAGSGGTNLLPGAVRPEGANPPMPGRPLAALLFGAFLDSTGTSATRDLRNSVAAANNNLIDLVSEFVKQDPDRVKAFQEMNRAYKDFLDYCRKNSVWDDSCRMTEGQLIAIAESNWA
jgi:hypothetical protein